MTNEPTPPGRTSRPGREARRRALGATAEPPARASLAESLARIPDLERDQAAVSPDLPVSSPAAQSAERAAVGAPLSPAAAALLDAPPAPEVAPADLDLGETASSGADVALRRRPPAWRRVAFALTLILLVGAIPALGYAGMQVIRDSTAGDVTSFNLNPSDPGYEAQVDTTPTAVALQFDEDGLPTAATFLALSGAEGGGVVIFVPLDTQVKEPAFGVGRLRAAYTAVADQPAVARERLATQIGQLLNVGIDEVIDLGNQGWAQLVAPVAPLEITNPDPLDLGYGIGVPSGPVALEAGQVGRYLEVLQSGESDLNRLNRHQVVWSAWLTQVAEAGIVDAVPGESTAGIGRFARELAAGPIIYQTLPVEPGPNATFIVDEDAVNQLVTDTIPAPTGAVPGDRFTVRLLNGVAAEAIPASVVQLVVGQGGAVTIIGNGPSFDRDETEIVYANPADAATARAMAQQLGATGPVRLDREAPDTVDLTIVLGRDVLGDVGAGAPGSTVPDGTSTLTPPAPNGGD